MRRSRRCHELPADWEPLRDHCKGRSLTLPSAISDGELRKPYHAPGSRKHASEFRDPCAGTGSVGIQNDSILLAHGAHQLSPRRIEVGRSPLGVFGIVQNARTRRDDLVGPRLFGIDRERRLRAVDGHPVMVSEPGLLGFVQQRLGIPSRTGRRCRGGGRRRQLSGRGRTRRRLGWGQAGGRRTKGRRRSLPTPGNCLGRATRPARRLARAGWWRI